jgi:hypothetical protein
LTLEYPVPLPRAFKTDESFLEKIAMGATGTRKTFADLRRQGHEPLELERGSMSFKIWKAIKIKRVRVPDVLCLRCSRRVESRAKSTVEISMSHSQTDPDRGWDAGLEDQDLVAIVPCRRVGLGPLDWQADPLVQYVDVEALRRAWRQHQTVAQRPKGAQEGFELRLTWPAAVTKTTGVVERVTEASLRYRTDAGRAISIQMQRQSGLLTALVAPGDRVYPNQIIAAVVPVTTAVPCFGSADVQTYVALSSSMSIPDRYAAVKALGQFPRPAALTALVERVRDPREHIYVRVEAAAGLMRRGVTEGAEFLAAALADDYLEHRLEAAIVLGEVGTPEAAALLMAALGDPDQNPEIRAGAAWSLGEVGRREALSTLTDSFNALETVIKVEAARALAKIARRHLGDVLALLPESTADQRPGIAWAISKAGGFAIGELLPSLVGEDARHWVAYIVGTQNREAMLPQVESLAARDPQVYFAVTVLWKIIASWVYGLEEY